MLLHTRMDKEAARQHVIELFKEVMLPRPEQIFDSYPHELSGGQKQRVMIAMAMSCQPDLLIADEPTTALDVTVQKGILELIRKLQAKYGMSVLFITHDLGVVAEIADRVLVMYKGNIVEEGSVRDLFLNPKHPYTMAAITHTEFNFPNQKSVYHGKVRDVYNINDEVLAMVASDRISAFDVILPKGIPCKGQILNQIAARFLDATADICHAAQAGGHSRNFR